jgi:hypothetical protein
MRPVFGRRTNVRITNDEVGRRCVVRGECDWQVACVIMAKGYTAYLANYCERIRGCRGSGRAVISLAATYSELLITR